MTYFYLFYFNFSCDSINFMKKKTNSPVVTEEYLDSRLDEFEGVINGRFDEFEDRIERKVDETISKSMDKLYTRIDPLLSELENNRLDRDLTTEQLRNLEKRVTKLESTN